MEARNLFVIPLCLTFGIVSSHQASSYTSRQISRSNQQKVELAFDGDPGTYSETGAHSSPWLSVARTLDVDKPVTSVKIQGSILPYHVNKLRIMVGYENNTIGYGRPKEDPLGIETCAVWTDPPQELDITFACVRPLEGGVVSVVAEANEPVTITLNEMQVFTQ